MSTSSPPSRTEPPAGAGAPPPRSDDGGLQETPGGQRRPAARPIGWGLALIGAGVLWLLHIAGVRIDWQLALPVAVIAIGLVLLIGGRHVAHGGLIGLGIVLTAIALVTSVTPMPVSLTAGDRIHTVTDLAQLDSSYRLGAGTLTLDLRELELPPGTTELGASVSLGELVVRVPDDATVTGTGHTIAGEVVSFGRTTEGLAPRRALDDPGIDAGPILDLDLRTGLGRIEVTR
jgi:hypothetical protein